MRLGRGALIVGSGLLITFIGLILLNIQLPEEGTVSVDWGNIIYVGWGFFCFFALGPFVILYGIFDAFSSES